MGKTIVFVNQKGGVGKTTTTLNLGSCLAEKGKKVLLVDFDPQSNLTSGLGIFPDNYHSSIYDVIIGNVPLNTILKKTVQENLFLAPSHLDLSGAAIELVNLKRRESFLKKALDPMKSDFDYILIDCPPSLGVLTLNGFVAADSVIVPLQCEYYALEGFLTMLFKTIKKIQHGLNQNLEVAGIIFTMYDSRTKLGNEIIQKVKEVFKNRPELLFKTIIPRNIKLSEAPSHGKPINIYDPFCLGALSYKNLAEEVINHV